jgi:hypothetical protein
VDELARVLLHVDAGQPDRTQLAVRLDGHLSSAGIRLVVLGNLVTLRKVRVKIVLTREGRERLDLAAQRQRCPQRELHRLPVDHGQHTRHPQVHLGGLGVGVRAEAVRRAAEQLRIGAKLCVDFEPDHGLPAFRHYFSYPRQKLPSQDETGSESSSA